METGIIINQLAIFGILMVIGAVASKTGIINSSGKDFLARFIVDITLPFLILTTFIRLDSNPKLLLNGLWVFGFTFLNLAIMYGIGKLSSVAQRLSKGDDTIHTLHTMFGNIVFLGFPLFDALFPGGTGVFYAAAYQLASNAVTFTYGIYRLSHGHQKSTLGTLFNINTIALIVGFALMLTRISLPEALVSGMEGLGKATSPLSMVYIGALLTGLGLKQSLRLRSIYILSVLKLLLIPVLLSILYASLRSYFNIDLSKEAFVVLVMQAAMPCQTLIVVMSKRYNGNYRLAAGNLFVTTILSIITLPLIFNFIVRIYG